MQNKKNHTIIYKTENQTYKCFYNIATLIMFILYSASFILFINPQYELRYPLDVIGCILFLSAVIFTLLGNSLEKTLKQNNKNSFTIDAITCAFNLHKKVFVSI